MSRYRVYPSYRNTSREWFPEIPAHWRDSKLRWLSTRYAGGTPDKNRRDYWEDGVIPWLNSGSVNQGEITKPSELITLEGFDNSSAKWIPVDALVMALAGQGKTKGMVAQTKIRTTCNQSMAAIVVHDNEPRYIYWWLCSQYHNIRGLTSDEGRDGLNLELVGGIRCPLPPLEEQHAIARFLDFKTAQIDALIAKKKDLLDKLAEKRTALISHAVTKGLDMSVAMKKSKVEWLGLVPQDWKETRVKFLGDLILGLTYSPDDVVSDGGTLVLRSSNVQEGKVSLDDCVYVGCDIPKKVITKDGDILICSRNGSRALIGKCALLTEEVSNQAFGAFMTVLRSKHSRFLYYVLNSTLFKFQSGRFLTSTINQLTAQTLGGFEIAFPPEETQAQIVSHLDKVTAVIDGQCRKVKTVIDRLVEYRAALLTNAVTGRIDVRDFEALHAVEGVDS